MAVLDLDDIDLKLISFLQEDCKVPLSKLGEQVGLTAPSVMERVRKLEQAGVIRGYHALVDARKVGLDITAFVGVSINYPKNIGVFEQSVVEEPGVLECHHVTGAHTLLLKVRAKNTEALEHLISRIRSFEGAERTETMVVLSTRIERIELPLEVTPSAPAPPRKRRAKT